MSVVEDRAEVEKKLPGQKRARFPGIEKHLSLVKEYTQMLKHANKSFEDVDKLLGERIEEYRKEIGQKELYDRKDSLSGEIKSLSSRKGELILQIHAIRDELRNLAQSVSEEKKRLNMKSTAELEQTLKNIEMRIRERPLSAREEKDISTEKNRVTKLLGMQGIFKEKDDMIREMEKSKKKEEEELHVLKLELERKNEEMGELVKKIEKNKKIVYPEDIKRLQEEKKRIIKERNEIREKKKVEFEAIDKKAEQYARKAAELEAAKERKERLVGQEQVIAGLCEKRARIEGEMNDDPCVQLRSLIFSIKKFEVDGKEGSKRISLPFSILGTLMKFRLPVPKSGKEVGATIQAAEALALEEEDAFLKRKEEIRKSLAEMDEKILREKEVHKNMPRPAFPKMGEDE
jgi:hypothetical protein